MNGETKECPFSLWAVATCFEGFLLPTGRDQQRRWPFRHESERKGTSSAVPTHGLNRSHVFYFYTTDCGLYREIGLKGGSRPLWSLFAASAVPTFVLTLALFLIIVALSACSGGHCCHRGGGIHAAAIFGGELGQLSLKRLNLG